MKNVLEFLNENLSGTVVVACSGGADSMCLLNLCMNVPNIKIVVAHVNHKVRSESDEEAEIVRKYAVDNNLIFEYKELNEFKSEKFSEASARLKRYEFFREVMEKYESNILLTAHHGDDLVETILMRLTRGSNLSGYAGIKMVDESRGLKIIRPLLTVTKEDIYNYVKTQNIPYVIDKSNDNLKYTRNRYRHNILPLLKSEYKDVHLKYLKYSEELLNYDTFIRNYVKKNNFIVDNSIIINNIKDEDYIVKKKCIELLIEEIQTSDYLDVSDKNMEDLIKLLEKKNKSIDIGNGYMGINNKGMLYMEKVNNNIIESQVLNKDITVINNYVFYYNNSDYIENADYIRLDSSEIELPISIRSREDGDVIEIKNLGSKKLSDVFINERIEKHKRNTIPVVIDAKNRILWVPFVKKSRFARDKSEKCDIIIKCEAR